VYRSLAMSTKLVVGWREPERDGRESLEARFRDKVRGVSAVPEREAKLSDKAGGRRWYADWRVWGTIAITGVCLWLAMRGVPIDDVMEAMEGADIPLLLIGSVPAYIAAVWVRALRWRYLTESIAPMDRAVLFRAMAIGFTANNLLPLRVGEVVRSWYLARQTGTSATSVLGSVAVERVIDIVVLLVLAIGGLAFVGSDSDEASLLAQGAMILSPIAVAPLLGLVLLRVRPEFVYATLRFFARPLPAVVGERVESVLRRFADGLGSLRGGSHLFWIVLHSVTIWLILSAIPMMVGMAAFGIELGSIPRAIGLSWVVLAVVGVAVAIPSAPGFVGPYQLAFKAVLVGLGVAPATALAVGLLVWLVFWVTLTTLGLVVLRQGHITLAELTLRPGKDPDPTRR
jgi:uncharacterized protein (TIRG00374 family)